jgi:hypothetical protein
LWNSSPRPLSTLPSKPGLRKQGEKLLLQKQRSKSNQKVLAFYTFGSIASAFPVCIFGGEAGRGWVLLFVFPPSSCASSPCIAWIPTYIPLEISPTVLEGSGDGMKNERRGKKSNGMEREMGEKWKWKGKEKEPADSIDPSGPIRLSRHLYCTFKDSVFKLFVHSTFGMEDALYLKDKVFGKECTKDTY